MPCSHEGEVIIGTFALCLKGCDGKPGTSGRKCSRCGSGKMNPFSAPLVPDGAYSCWDCGRVDWTP
jgi:hypothetical protein